MQTIYLDISNKGVIPTIYAKQGDVGRKFQIVLTDLGLPYVPASGSAFSVWYSGASGEGNYTDIGNKPAFTVIENKVIVEMISQMLSNDGDGVLSLVLNDPNGNQISTWNIPYICEYVPGADGEEAKAYYTAFSQAVENLPYPDASLSVPGKAADAAATGKALEGKAPAGFGYGEPLAVYSVETEEELETKLLEILNTMSNYTTKQVRFMLNFLGVTTNYLTTIYKHTSTYALVTFQTMRFGGASLLKVYANSSWNVICWENPPMNLGVEYRTTERWNGKAVYTKVFDFGALPNASSKTVAINIPTTFIVRADHVIHSSDGKVIQSPYFLADGTLVVKHLITGSGIQISTTADYSGYTATFQIWYTKEDWK